MSADLLAEFDSFYQAPTAQQQASRSTAFDDLTSLGSGVQERKTGDGGSKGSQWQTSQTRSNEDIWGQMSAFQPSNAREPTPPATNIWASLESKPSLPASHVDQFSSAHTQQQAKPPIVRRDTLEMFSSRQVEGWGSSGNGAQVRSQSNDITSASSEDSRPAPKKTFDGDILFDADNLSEEEGEDDFGDFEEATPVIPIASQPVTAADTKVLEGMFGAVSMDSAKQSKRPAQLSPVSPNFDDSTLSYPQAPKSPSFQERNPFADLGVNIGQVSKLKNPTREGSPVTPWPSFAPPMPEPYQDSPVPASDIDDDWGDFEETPGEQPVSFTKPPAVIEAEAWGWDVADGVTKGDAVPEEIAHPPPTNVPPPSVLLPLFTPLFDLSNSTLFQPIKNQTITLKTRILSDPSTIDFLSGYLLVARVAAYVIAGRKNRWKRDTLLSQAMKIGPAAAGGKSGMKLAGVDRAEIAREEREVADTVRAWKEQLGKLKAAVVIANSSSGDPTHHLTIPEISDTMHVKAQEGAMSAPKQCVICGLKRDERVAKVDINVEDSFGEWWTDHWGHRSCRNFWLEHESKLRQR